MKYFRLLLCIFLIIFGIEESVLASSLNGASSIIYKNIPHVFHDGDQAIGFVALKKGFTVLEDEGVRLSLAIPVSYGMDLNFTGSIVLENDLSLDSGFTLSSSGTICGSGYSLLLNDDLIIPAQSTLKVTSTLTIDGNEHTIFFDGYAQILVDSHATLTLKNVILKNLFNSPGNPPINTNGIDSKVAFDNVTFDLADDFFFNRGSFYIHNNVKYKGASCFYYLSPQVSFIAPKSTFYFDNNSSFFYNPQNTASNPIIMQDSSSILFFDGSTLKSTPTGLVLDTGKLYFDNKINLDAGVRLNFPLADLMSIEYGTSVYATAWAPDGNYVAIGGIGAQSGKGGFLNTDEVRLYKFDITIPPYFTPVTSVKFGTAVFTLSWSNNGRYLSIGGFGAASGVGGFDNTDNVRLYEFDPINNLLTPIVSTPFFKTKSIDWRNDDEFISVSGTGRWDLMPPLDKTHNSYSIAWTPDGRYLAVANYGQGNNLYRLDAQNLQLVFTTTEGDFSDSVAWTPDGNYLAVGNDGNGNKLYRLDGESLTLVFTTEEHDKTYPVAWTPDGNYLAVGNYDGSGNRLYRRDGESLTLVFTASEADETYSLAWTPDGHYLAVGNYGQVNRLYRKDGESLTLVFSTVETDSTESVAWSPDGHYLAVGNYGDGNRLYRLDSETLTLVFTTIETNYTTSVAWTPDGVYLSACNDGDPNNLYRLDGETLTLVFTTDTSYAVYSSAWTPDGQYLAFGTLGHGTGIYNLSAETLMLISQTIKDLTGGYNSVSAAWTPDGNYLAIGNNSSQGTRIYKRNGDSLTAICTPQEHDNTFAVAWSPDGGYLATGNASGKNRLYKKDGDFLTLVFSTIEIDSTWSVAWTSDGKYLAVGNFGQPNRLYRLDGEILTLVFSTVETDDTDSVAWTPDGNYLAVGNSTGQQNRLYRKDGESLTLVFSTTESDDTASVAWTSNGLYLAAGNFGQPNRLYRLDGETLTLVFSTLESDPTSSVAWTGDGHLAVGNSKFGGDGTSRMYKLNGEILTLVYSIPTQNYTQDVAWTPDGIHLAFANYNNPSTLYRRDGDLLTYVYADAIVELLQTGKSAAWSPNGIYLAIGGYDSFNEEETIKVYKLDPISLSLKSVSSISALSVTALAWSPSGNYIAVSRTGNEAVYKFDTSTETISLVSEFFSGRDNTSVAWKFDGGYIIFGNKDKTPGCVRIYTFDSLTETFNYVRNVSEADDTRAVAWSKQYRSVSHLSWFVSGNYGQPNRSYRFNDSGGLFLEASTVETDNTTSLAFSLTDSSVTGVDFLLVGNDGEPNRINEFTYGYFGSNISIPNSDNVSSVAWNLSGNLCAFGAYNQETVFYYFDKDLNIVTLMYTIPTYNSTQSIAFNPTYPFFIECNEYPQSICYNIDQINSSLEVYAFDYRQKLLSIFAPLTSTYQIGSDINSAKWIFSGEYLAAGFLGQTQTTGLNVFYFDKYNINQSLRLQPIGASTYGCASSNINSVDWTSEGRYVLVSGDTPYASPETNLMEPVQIYEFEPTNPNPLSLSAGKGYYESVELTTRQIAGGCASWMPNSYFVASSDKYRDDAQVYQFRPQESSRYMRIDPIDIKSPGSYQISWSPSGKIMASGYDLAAYFYRFGQIPQEFVASEYFADPTSLNRGIESVSWHPNKKHIAIGGLGAGSAGGFDNNDGLRIYKFNDQNNTLTPITSQPYGDMLMTCAWCPDGIFLAIVGNGAVPGGGFPNTDELRIYEFSDNELIPVTSQAVGGPYRTLAWHPNGLFLAVAEYDAGIEIYEFDGTSLSFVNSYPDYCRHLEWSPDGQYLAAILGAFINSKLSVLKFVGYSPLSLITQAEGGFDVSWSSDGQQIVTAEDEGSVDPAILIYKFTGTNLVLECKSISNLNESPRGIKFAKDGHSIASPSGGGPKGTQLFYFDEIQTTSICSKGTGVQNISLAWRSDQNYIAAGAFHPDPDLLATVPDLFIYKMNYNTDPFKQRIGLDLKNGLDMHILGGANVEVNGIVNYEKE